CPVKPGCFRNSARLDRDAARQISPTTALVAAGAFLLRGAAPVLTRLGARNGAIWREPRNSLGCGLFLILGPKRADTTITVVHTRVGAMEKPSCGPAPARCFR